MLLGHRTFPSMDSVPGFPAASVLPVPSPSTVLLAVEWYNGFTKLSRSFRINRQMSAVQSSIFFCWYWNKLLSLSLLNKKLPNLHEYTWVTRNTSNFSSNSNFVGNCVHIWYMQSRNCKKVGEISRGATFFWLVDSEDAKREFSLPTNPFIPNTLPPRKDLAAVWKLELAIDICDCCSSLVKWPQRSLNLKPKETHSFSMSLANPSIVRKYGSKQIWAKEDNCAVRSHPSLDYPKKTCNELVRVLWKN